MSGDACTCVCIRPMQRDASGAPIAPAEWEQAPDCPVHPMTSWCPECGAATVIVEDSDQRDDETIRGWVSVLDCGHEVVTPAALWATS